MSTYVCIVCGKDLPNPQWWVHMNTLGEYIPLDEEVPEEQEMGLHPVGPECRKRDEVKDYVAKGV